MMRNARSVIGLLALALVGAPACGTAEASFDVGLQKVALDLAFKDESLAKDGDGTLRPLPVESQAELVLSLPPDRRSDPPPYVFRDTCPSAPSGAFVEEPVSRTIKRTVPEGRYQFHDKGEFEVTGPIPLKGALPPFSLRDYRDAEAVPQEPEWTFAGEPVPQPVQNEVPDHHVWAIVQPLFGDDYIRRDFEATDNALLLTKLTIQLGDAKFVFQPEPAIRMMDLGPDFAEDATWSSAGTDPETGTSMVVRGGIERRETVDACGTVYDAWKIRSTEQIVSLSGGFTSQTDDANDVPYFPEPKTPNYYWVAPQFGGMFLREETHTTTTFGATVISIDGVSTISSLDARPLPPAPE